MVEPCGAPKLCHCQEEASDCALLKVMVKVSSLSLFSPQLEGVSDQRRYLDLALEMASKNVCILKLCWCSLLNFSVVQETGLGIEVEEVNGTLTGKRGTMQCCITPG